MHYYEVAPNQIIRANSSFFTYTSDEPLRIGQIVVVEVGKRKLIGVILRKTRKPSYATKAIDSIIEETPLPQQLITLAQWMASYYSSHLSTVLQTLLPRGLQKSRRARTTAATIPIRNRTNIVFTNDQTHAIKTIDLMSPGTAILHGVTGSGKTAVYIELVKRTLTKGNSAIILVPEIALTSQLVEEFSQHFQDIILAHSRQTEAERHLAWRDALTSEMPRVVIGPRSALFMPLRQLGLVIIDESHEPSFKQEQSPRYSALRAASILMQQYKGKLVLGSATPAVTDYYLAEQSNRPIIPMIHKAQANAAQPTIDLVDMTKRTGFKSHRFLSDKLIAQMEKTLANNEQVLIFHNRRGSANMTLCDNCGWSASCMRCFTPLTLHADSHQLRCHICGITEPVPTSCPECQSTDIIHKGIGTKLIEFELRKLFPRYTIARFDADSEADQSLEQRYGDLYNGNIHIIIGTQVIAKGLDLPHLRTVGVIQADAGLNLPDYGSSERTFQLLAQVIGRVGRSHHATNVIVQSYQPHHLSIIYGLSQDYAQFYTGALAERKRGHFPPFAYLLKLTCIYKTESAAIKHTQDLARTLRSKNLKDVEILGPAPAFYERQHDAHRWQLILKSSRRSSLIDVLIDIPSSHWQFELDPVSLL